MAVKRTGILLGTGLLVAAGTRLLSFDHVAVVALGAVAVAVAAVAAVAFRAPRIIDTSAAQRYVEWAADGWPDRSDVVTVPMQSWED